MLPSSCSKFALPRRPDVQFRCDIDFDPFRFMEDNNKTYCPPAPAPSRR
jgi:hypothetical protein